MPTFFRSSANVVLTDTESNTASTATPASAFCSSKEIPSFSYASKIFGSTSSRLPRGFLGAEKYDMLW